MSLRQNREVLSRRVLCRDIASRRHLVAIPVYSLDDAVNIRWNCKSVEVPSRAHQIGLVPCLVTKLDGHFILEDMKKLLHQGSTMIRGLHRLT